MKPKKIKLDEYTTPEVFRLQMGISLPTYYKWRKQGLKICKINRLIRIRKADVDDFLTSYQEDENV